MKKESERKYARKKALEFEEMSVVAAMLESLRKRVVHREHRDPMIFFAVARSGFKDGAMMDPVADSSARVLWQVR